MAKNKSKNSGEPATVTVLDDGTMVVIRKRKNADSLDDEYAVTLVPKNRRVDYILPDWEGRDHIQTLSHSTPLQRFGEIAIWLDTFGADWKNIEPWLERVGEAVGMSIYDIHSLQFIMHPVYECGSLAGREAGKRAAKEEGNSKEQKESNNG